MHTTPEENRYIRALESRLDPEHSPVDELLRLGQLYLCPEHDDEKGMEIFGTILRREPGHVWASYWYAHCCLHYLMTPDALQEGKSVLEAAIDAHPSESGALYTQLYAIAEELGGFTPQQQLGILEKSVQLEPDWVLNRYLLGMAYHDEGRLRDAVAQLEAALRNLLPEDWVETDAVIGNFEVDVTGRNNLHLREVVPRELRDMRRREND